jgi:hypothetical protein
VKSWIPLSVELYKLSELTSEDTVSASPGPYAHLKPTA